MTSSSSSLSSLYPSALAYIQSGGDRSLKPSQSQQLEFYALFKQIQHGQNTTKAPSRLKLVERTKWDSWNKLGKMSAEDAKVKYVELLTKIDPKWKDKVKKDKDGKDDGKGSADKIKSKL